MEDAGLEASPAPSSSPWGRAHQRNDCRHCGALRWGTGGTGTFLKNFILFFSFGNTASCSHAVTVKIRFKLQGWLWLFPFLSEFLPTCNLLNEILLFRLTGIFFADVDLTQLYKICELCSFFPIFNNLRILVQELDRVYNVDSIGFFVLCKYWG